MFKKFQKSFSENLEGALLLEKIYNSISFIEDSKIQVDEVIKGTKQVHHKDKWYYIPNILLNDFSKSVLELSLTSTIQDEDVFLKKYMKYGNENYQKTNRLKHFQKVTKFRFDLFNQGRKLFLYFCHEVHRAKCIHSFI